MPPKTDEKTKIPTIADFIRDLVPLLDQLFNLKELASEQSTITLLKEKAAEIAKETSNQIGNLKLIQYIYRGLEGIRHDITREKGGGNAYIRIENLEQFLQLYRNLVSPPAPHQSIRQQNIEIERQRLLEQKELASKAEFTQLLAHIKSEAIKNGYTRKKVFISYAWPLDVANSLNESYAQKFVEELQSHLEKAGLMVIRDQSDNMFVNVHRFMKGEITNAEHVIVICNRTMQHKFYDLGDTGVVEEFSHYKKLRAEKQRNKQDKNFILLVNTTYEDNAPGFLSEWKKISTYQNGYLQALFELIYQIYDVGKEFKSICENALKKYNEIAKYWQRELHDGALVIADEKTLVTNSNPIVSTSPSTIESKADPIASSVQEKLLRLRSLMLNNKVIHDELANYIPVCGVHRQGDTKSFDLEEAVSNFFKTDKKVLLLLGEPGGGKSTFNRFLAQRLWQVYKPGELVPFFVPLPNLHNPKTQLLEEFLANLTHFVIPPDSLDAAAYADISNLNFTSEEIQFVKKKLKFVLILDGYDEMRIDGQLNNFANLYVSNAIANWHNPNIKMLVACRFVHLAIAPNYNRFFMPLKAESFAADLFMEITVAPFNDQQIDAYVHKYIELHQQDLKNLEGQWQKKETYLMHIKNILGLAGLIVNPFLLMIAVDVMPNIIDKYSHHVDGEREMITRAALYDAFVDKWFRREGDKLMVKLMTAGEGLPQPREGEIDRHYLDFSQRLAIEMHKRDTNRAYYDPVLAKKYPSWEEEFFSDKDQIIVRNRKGCPLKRVTDYTWAFIHVSLIDYFVTRESYEKSMHAARLLPPPKEDKEEYLAPPLRDDKNENRDAIDAIYDIKDDQKQVKDPTPNKPVTLPLTTTPSSSSGDPTSDLGLELTASFLAEQKAVHEFWKNISHKKLENKQTEAIKKQRGEVAQRLYQLAEQKGYECIDVPDDDNCQFHAIAAQLKLHAAELSSKDFKGLATLDHVALRARAVRIIEHNKVQFKQYVPENKIEQYIEKMRRIGEWGDQLTLLALSQALNVNINLIHADGNILQLPEPFKNSALTTLNIGYNGHNHYWSLKVKPSPRLSISEVRNQTFFHDGKDNDKKAGEDKQNTNAATAVVLSAPPPS